ncbi:MAG: type II toxin-antitoxin system VapC family toxin [Deltaproteobacteria bacterium]|nr:type II toxin-antitoxin system VapC family toxin [Deltaproteobacteria bacterium]
MKKKRLLDSYAMLAYLQKEDDYQKVVELMSSNSNDGLLIMNEINVGEAYYIIARERGTGQADYFLETILPSLPVKLIPNSLENVIEAARIKSRYPISYADSFVVATAVREKAVIVTGDPDFKKVKDLVEVDWLR